MNYFTEAVPITMFLTLVVLVNRIVAGFFTPIVEKLKIDKDLLMYMAWGLGAYIIFMTELNLFAAIIPDPLVGKILTSIAVGGGANILHDATDQPAPETIAAMIAERGFGDQTDR